MQCRLDQETFESAFFVVIRVVMKLLIASACVAWSDAKHNIYQLLVNLLWWALNANQIKSNQTTLFIHDILISYTRYYYKNTSYKVRNSLCDWSNQTKQLYLSTIFSSVTLGITIKILVTKFVIRFVIGQIKSNNFIYPRYSHQLH